MKTPISIDHQIQQARLIKRLTAENNQLRSEVKKLKAALEQVSSNNQSHTQK
jgi:cell division protein FtsB